MLGVLRQVAVAGLRTTSGGGGMAAAARMWGRRARPAKWGLGHVRVGTARAGLPGLRWLSAAAGGTDIHKLRNIGISAHVVRYWNLCVWVCWVCVGGVCRVMRLKRLTDSDAIPAAARHGTARHCTARGRVGLW